MASSLSIYRITVNERRKTDELRILSDINGTDLLSLTDTFLKTWLSSSSEVKTSKESKRAYRISQNHTFEGRIIYGIIDSGEYGQQLEVVNINNSEGKYTIKPDEAPLMPFFFMFYYPEDKPYGFLILQRIGPRGIYSILSKEFITFVGKELDVDYVIKVHPFVIANLLKQNLSLVSKATSITVKRKDSVLFNKVSMGILDGDGVLSETKFYLPRNRYFDIIEWLKVKLGEKNEVSQKLVDTSMIDDADISLDVKLSNGKERTLRLGNISQFGTNLPLSDDIELDDKGYPTFRALKQEALTLVDHIATLIENNEKKDT